MSTRHFIRTATDVARLAQGDMAATVTGSCGSSVNAWKARFQGMGTTDRADVTCKRCLKTLEAGMSVELGHLV